MKKTSILIALSALLLTVGGIVLSRATAGVRKKSATALSAYFTPDHGSVWFTLFTIGPGWSALTTKNAPNKTARVRTVSGFNYVLYTAKSISAHVLYY